MGARANPKCVQLVFKSSLNHRIKFWSCVSCNAFHAMIHLSIEFGHVSDSTSCTVAAARKTSPIPTLPGPLYPSLTAPRGPKRSRFPVKGSSLKVRCRVHFSKGTAVTGTLDGSDGSDPIARTAPATPMMAHQVQSGAVGLTAPLS